MAAASAFDRMRADREARDAAELERRAIAETRRLISSMRATYRRIDSGQLTGRNCVATDRGLAAKWHLLQKCLEAGGFEELDRSSRLDLSYRTLERRHLLAEKQPAAEHRGRTRAFLAPALMLPRSRRAG